MKKDELFLQKSNRVSLKTTEKVEGFDIIWLPDIFSALALSVWKRKDLCQEMQYWIQERIQSTQE